jgi:hypothetical protein
MTSPNVPKVETNLLKLFIGILYQVHMTYLPAVKMPPGLNYLNKAIEFWARRIPIVKTTLQNTLDCINKKITDKTALDQNRKTEFLLPSAKLVEEDRQDFTDKKKLQPYTSSGIEDGSPARRDRGRKHPRNEEHRERERERERERDSARERERERARERERETHTYTHSLRPY